MSKELAHFAAQACSNAYARYSKFTVGAAVKTSDGTVFQGCNVENASYGLTVCAERNAIASAIVAGFRDLETIAIYTAQNDLTPPCGACRQVIAEFFKPEAIVTAHNHKGESVTWTVESLLPDAFTPINLDNADKE
ncbi:cytidine deaminase [Thalassotalea agarivorans]|uniref:Cytidine deaminase n=1 Tax=Thalassotalea agarivorans TaxID=349064 RepID=A0A1I0DF00_THASX|nr:cytidine deaminase [Thalassotalea agarivorans]SET30313.1 cytidine deaminase [Thalassotalea agarivorans]